MGNTSVTILHIKMTNRGKNPMIIINLSNQYIIKLVTGFFNISYSNKLSTNFFRKLRFTITLFPYLFVISNYMVWCSSLLLVLSGDI